jgi:ribosomal protein L37AE/L43A
MANGMRQMFEPFEKRARQEHSCPCCERSFTADEEASFIKKVTQSSPVFALTIQIIFCF